MSQTTISELDFFVAIFTRNGASELKVVVSQNPESSLKSLRTKLKDEEIVLYENPIYQSSKKKAYELREMAYDLLVDCKGRKEKPPQWIGNITAPLLRSFYNLISIKNPND